MTLGVRVLIQDDAGKILLVRHGYVSGWHLPGGGVEKGETAAQAAKKELLEETGLAALDEPELIAIYANQKVTRRDHVVLYKISKWRRDRKFESNIEIERIDFFSRDNLPQDTTPSTIDRLNEIFDGKPKAGIW